MEIWLTFGPGKSIEERERQATEYAGKAHQELAKIQRDKAIVPKKNAKGKLLTHEEVAASRGI